VLPALFQLLAASKLEWLRVNYGAERPSAEAGQRQRTAERTAERLPAPSVT